MKARAQEAVEVTKPVLIAEGITALAILVIILLMMRNGS